MTPKGAKIISPARLQVPFPASDVELRSLVLLKTWWGLLGASEEEDWLVCIAALLQFVSPRWFQIIPHSSTLRPSII